MSRVIILFIAPLMVVAGGLAGCAGRGPAEPVELAPDDTGLADLAFLAGSWTTGPGGADRVEEHWTQPSAGGLMGMARTVRDGQTVFFEFLRVQRTADGVFYIASPRGGETTHFKLVERRPGRLVFENPDHDFPTRILYERLTDGRLHARIEGTQRGRPAAEDWFYHRAVIVTGPGT